MKIRHYSALFTCAVFVCAAHAADLTWDGNTSAGITNTSAAWDAANVWYDETAETNVSFTSGDNVTFTATDSQGYAVTTGATGPYSVGNMTFSSTSDSATGINLNSPAIEVSGAASTAVGHTGLVICQGLVSGTGSFTIAGGELRLINNGNTFAGGFTLNGGLLRVGNGSGTGAPQTSGSLGTGTLTINGGTIFQAQANLRTQAVPVVVGGNFAFNSIAGGGLTLGGTGSTANIGNAVRTITVSQNNDGTGANSLFGLSNLVGGSSSGIVKEGAGFLTIESRKPGDVFSFTGNLTVNQGELRLSSEGGTNATNTTGDIGASQISMTAGTTLRIMANEIVSRGTVLTLNGADIAVRNNLNTSRRTGMGTLQVTGTSRVDFGSGLLIASAGASGVGGIRVADQGVLGGNGTLQTGISNNAGGVVDWTGVVDATVDLRFSGYLSPGTPGALDSTIATLSVGGLLWQGHSSAAPMKFNLGSANQSDRLVLSGNLARDGATATHSFDFLGTGVAGQTYTLITFATIDGTITQEMFAATNLASGVTGSFSLNANSLTFTTDPGSGGTPFQDWVGGPPFNLAGNDALEGSDPDNDGVNNLAEFALDGDPTSGSNNGKKFVKMAVVNSVPNVLTLTIAARDGASFGVSGNRQTATIDGVIYTIEAATDLANWGTPVVTQVTGVDATTIQTGLPAPNTGWSYHTFRCQGNAGDTPKAFLRARFEVAAP